MAIALRAAGAWAAGSTQVTPALPTGTLAGDLMIAFIASKPYTAFSAPPSGWTALHGNSANGSVASGVDTGSVTWATYWRIFQTGDVAGAFTTGTGNVTLGVIKSFSKDAQKIWDDPSAKAASDNTSGTAFSLALGQIPLITGDMLAHFAVIAGNNATFGTPTIVGSGSAVIGAVTESPATEGSSTTGDDLEASASHALVTTGDLTASVTCGWTLSVAQTGGGSVARLRELDRRARNLPFVPGQAIHASVR